MKRFLVKKLKLVLRNSMLQGNPIEKSFSVFGIFDRNWQSDKNCGVSFCGYEWHHHGMYHAYGQEFRIILQDEDQANRLANSMNTCNAAFGNPASIGFSSVDHKYCPILKDNFVLEITSFNKS